MMSANTKAIIFLCSGTTKVGDKKLSHRIALQLQDMNIGEIGNLEILSQQHRSLPEQRRPMIFINDCNSSCVKLLTHGFESHQYLYIDVKEYKSQPDFDINVFIDNHILGKV
jgi:uncharacterized metal-binding protein